MKEKNDLSFSDRILKALSIRPNEKTTFFNFFLFNLVLYAGIFLGRAIRDGLFFTKIGANYLPFVFIANAISMSIFGTYFAKWTGGKYSLKKVSISLFFYSAIVVFVFSFLFSLDISGNVPNIDFSLEKLAIILFYWLTEIPIFLMIVVIWIIAGNYISESMGQRLNPKIIGGGHIGIVLGGIIAVFAPSMFKIQMQSLSYVWGGVVILEILMIMIIYKVCKPLPTEREEEIIEAPPLEEEVGFFADFKNSFKVVRKYKFSIYFALIALFNFFLFGINDYMLNSRAIAAGISEDRLIAILGYFTIGFGILSAVTQFSFMTKIIKKFGVAKANMGGALIFVAGFSILFLTSTNMFEPLQDLFVKITGLQKAWLLLYSIAMVRFGGYIAEYLFNQSMLPPIYGAIPDEDREVTRTFIEGTFVQMVFGLTGLFLIAYRFIFKQNLDLMILLGAIAASLMLVFSWRLISEYKEMIKLSKKSIKEQIIEKVIGKVNREKVKKLFNRKNKFIKKSLIEFLCKNKKEEFVGDIYNQLGENTDINISVINGIIEFNNMEYFDRLLNEYIEFDDKTNRFLRFKRFNKEEVRTMLSGFYRMHHSHDVFSIFEEIEKNERLTIEQMQEIIFFFSKLRNKNGILKASAILENLASKDEKIAQTLSAEIGFDNFAEKIYESIKELIDSIYFQGKTEETDKEEIENKEKLRSEKIEELCKYLYLVEKINYSKQSVLFKTFEKILESIKIMELRSQAADIAKNIISKNIFLPLIAVNNLTKNDPEIPVEELPFLLADVPPLNGKELTYLTKLYPMYSIEKIPMADGYVSVNKLLEDFIKKGKPALTLNSYKILKQRVKTNIEEDYEIESKSELFENELKKLYLMWILVWEFKPIDRSIYLFAKKRVKLYQKNLLYSLSLLPGVDASDNFDVELFYRNISSVNRLLKDNSITLMEQILPRDYFREIDEYFYLDDKSNPSREEELAAKAKEKFKKDVGLRRIYKILNDDILINLIGEKEVNHESQ